MHIPKRYGESRRDGCPFCSKTATTTNSEGVPVCVDHKQNTIPEMKCLCGDTLELKNGKFGAFYNCISCGNMNLSRAFEINDIKDMTKVVSENKQEKKESKSEPKKQEDKYSFATIPEKKNPREIVVNADDPFWCS